MSRATLLTLVVALPAYAGTDLDAGLVGLWTFDEGAGTIATDSSGRGHHGTLFEGATWTRGRQGAGVTFEGLDGGVRIGRGPTLDDLPAFTFAAWIFPRSSGELPPYPMRYGVIVNKGGSGAQGNKRFLINDACEYPKEAVGGLELVVNRLAGADALCAPKGTIVPLEWQHVAGTWSPSTGVKVFRNGLEVLSAPAQPDAGPPVSDATHDLLLGTWPNGNATFDGVLDEVRVYERELSAEEIRALFDPTSVAPVTPGRSPRVLTVGCGCGSGSASPGLAFGFAALVLAGKRRSRVRFPPPSPV